MDNTVNKSYIKPYANFDAKVEKEKIVTWIQAWFSYSGPTASAVIGISGGKDSTIVAALCVEALGKERVVGVLMPNGVQADIDDAERVVEHLGIKHYVANIEKPFLAMQGVYISTGVGKVNDAVKQNLAPRLRMATLYAIAQGLPNGGRVANTCNKSEDFIGYSTKYGDSAGDFAPLASYVVEEVLAIGDLLDIPKDLVHKTPSDGLCGKTDEDNFGFTYAVLDHYIRTGQCDDDAIKAKIQRMHLMNLHKVSPMPAVPREDNDDDE